jgi:hypothetical protein
MGDPEIFLDMMDVQQEVLAAHNIPQAVQSSAGAFLSPALTLNHSLSTDLVADPALSTAALDCLTTTKAPGTVKSYSTVVLRFQAFSLLASHPFPHLTTEAVTQFFLHAVRHTGYAFLSCIKPALVYLEVAMGKASSFTPTVNLLLKGANGEPAPAADQREGTCTVPFAASFSLGIDLSPRMTMSASPVLSASALHFVLFSYITCCAAIPVSLRFKQSISSPLIFW